MGPTVSAAKGKEPHTHTHTHSHTLKLHLVLRLWFWDFGKCDASPFVAFTPRFNLAQSGYNCEVLIYKSNTSVWHNEMFASLKWSRSYIFLPDITEEHNY